MFLNRISDARPDLETVRLTPRPKESLSRTQSLPGGSTGSAQLPAPSSAALKELTALPTE